MGRKDKITDEELEKQLQNGKSEKEIAHQYGYGYPSRRLKDRIKNLGFRKRNKFTFIEDSYANIQLKKDEVKALFESCELSKSDEPVYAAKKVEDGKVVIEPTRAKWEKQNE